MRKLNEKHGESKTRIYNIWRGMRERCYRKTHDAYRSYGGRGIIVCDEWKNSYVAFSAWAKANGYRCDKSIDRIDPDGNYEPGNCRWSTDKQQAKNKRRSNEIAYQGKTHTLGEWAKITGINYSTLAKRLQNGASGKELFQQTKLYRDKNVLAILETKNGKAKLTSAQVADIRSSALSGAELARKHGVAQSTISMIRNGTRR